MNVQQLTTDKHETLHELAIVIARELATGNDSVATTSAETDRVYHSLVYMVEELIDRLNSRRLRAAFWNVLSTDVISCHYELAACIHELVYFSRSVTMTTKVSDYIVEHKKKDPEVFFITFITELITLHEEEKKLQETDGVNEERTRDNYLVYTTYYERLRNTILITLQERQRIWNTNKRDDQSTLEKEKDNDGEKSLQLETQQELKK